MATNKYAAIYAISSELAMSNDDLHTFVYSITQKESLRELDQRELASVVAHLQMIKDSAKGNRRSRNYTYGGNPETERQRKKIFMLMKAMNWNEQCICGLAKKIFNTDAIEWLSRDQCSKLIEALKNIGQE